MLSDTNTVKRVCSIRFVMIIRFLFGYYFDIHKSPILQILSKFYCVAFTCLINYILYINKRQLNHIGVVSSIIARVLLTVMALYNKGEYILDFFRYRSITDSLPFAKETFKLLGKLLKLSAVCVLGFKIITMYFFCIPYHNFCYRNPFTILVPMLHSLSLEVGCLSFILVFALLYCRVKTIKNTLLKKGFTNSPRHRFRPRKYMQMYETVLRTLEDANNPLKLLVFSYMLTFIPMMISGMFFCLQSLKEEGPNYGNVPVLCTIFLPLVPFIIAAILLDMAAEDTLDIKCFALERCLECSNERDRSELQQLFTLIDDYPLQYNMFRVFPLSVKPLLGLLSFTITTIIAILQIQKF